MFSNSENDCIVLFVKGIYRLFNFVLHFKLSLRSSPSLSLLLLAHPPPFHSHTAGCWVSQKLYSRRKVSPLFSHFVLLRVWVVLLLLWNVARKHSSSSRKCLFCIKLVEVNCKIKFIHSKHYVFLPSAPLNVLTKVRFIFKILRAINPSFLCIPLFLSNILISVAYCTHMHLRGNNSESSKLLTIINSWRPFNND